MCGEYIHFCPIQIRLREYNRHFNFFKNKDKSHSHITK